MLRLTTRPLASLPIVACVVEIASIVAVFCASTITSPPLPIIVVTSDDTMLAAESLLTKFRLITPPAPIMDAILDRSEADIVAFSNALTMTSPPAVKVMFSNVANASLVTSLKEIRPYLLLAPLFFVSISLPRELARDLGIILSLLIVFHRP